MSVDTLVDTLCYNRDNRGRQIIEDHVLYSLSPTPDQQDDDGEVTTSLLYDTRTQPVIMQMDHQFKKTTTKNPNQRKPGIFGLFRYATACDVLLLLIGLIFSASHGASFPLLALVFGQMTNTFILYTTKFLLSNNISSVDTTVTTSNKSSPLDVYPTLTADEFSSYMAEFSMKYLYIGIGVLFAAFIQTWCWEMACERQVHRLRRVFLSQILRQDISWFDVHNKGDLTTKLSDDIERIREGIGSKFSIVIQYVATFLSGIIVGLFVNWKLTTLIVCIGPLLIGTSAYMAKITASSAAREQLKYSLAGRVAEEVLNCFRTVAAFGGEMKEVSRYSTALDQGRKLAMRKYYTLAVGLAVMFFIMYASYGAAFWYGSQLIGAGECTPGSVFTVFFSVMAGAFSLGNALPFVNAVSTAIGAASTLFSVIDRKPDIDSYSDEGLKPNNVNGRIKFENVTFCYPARTEVKVLKGLSFAIEPGKTVALVGPSGAGKSTIVSLLLRFYDPTSGRILLDGTPIKDINLNWLRSQIGVVSQEPVLFGVSIAENIRYGNQNVTQHDIERAATVANAHSFIQNLPQKYETLVGDRGAQLSGGQKQRIAIARALVKDPKILLLDEATSSLDVQSEAIVQDALDKAVYGRTTLIIAHRLSTVKNSDIIYAMEDGVVVEKGTHAALMDNHGLYYNLVVMQANASAENDTQNNDNTEQNKNQLVPPVISIMSSSAVSLYENSSIRSEDIVKTPHKVELPNVGMCRLLKLNAPEWLNLTVGLLGCAMMGSIMPIYAFFYGEVFSTFTLTGEELKKAAMFWTMMFLLLACLSSFSSSVQILGMTTSIEKLVMRIRLLAFTNIMRQSIGWFDMDNNSAGRLATRLAREAPLIKGAAGVRAGQIISSMVTLLSAMVIAFLFGWKLALLLLVAVPCLIGAAYQQTMVLRRYQRRDFKLMDDAGKVASECVQNIRTVQSLAREHLFTKLYMNFLILPYKEAKKQCFSFAVTYAFSQAVIYIMYAAAFGFGAYLVEIGDMTPTDVYRVFFSLAFCAASVGQTSAYIQDYTKAKMAAGRLFQLIEIKSDIDVTSTTGIKPAIKGKVSFDNVHFSYPSRPDVKVLRGLRFTVEPGKTLALVGASGCGKSTVISLIERFYEPSYGTVMVDDMDIRSINLRHIRSHIGLVTQEPVLFDCSIKDNIAYGLGGAADLLHTDQLFNSVMQAARTANIHNFIVNLPKGYDTLVGEKGTQLSGGQKQRIAIARALIRNPKILLLDEATSALDAENEKIVQEALDQAREGRTCIIVAHRLTTIQNADSIAVIHRGKIVEQGTHESLTDKQGHYSRLTGSQ